jgi:hypothetical protein
LSTTYISAELRRQIVARAEHLCEYCLIHEDDTFFGCEIDHVISEKHGGQTEADNLAYACLICNRNKGSDVGSIVPPLSSGVFCRFFNPRIDRWSEHFGLDEADDAVIRPLTDIGDVTARIFAFNISERLLERQALRDVGRYPTAEALRRMEDAGT